MIKCLSSSIPEALDSIASTNEKRKGKEKQKEGRWCSSSGRVCAQHALGSILTSTRKNNKKQQQQKTPQKCNFKVRDQLAEHY